ncbi:MAG TPA: acyltransferase [Arsenicitalea sp.]|jgi:peptidoglycan/LPS O-acetylase OafA/YrhL|nr:acyltransferase [Arsenicitalea sp.]
MDSAENNRLYGLQALRFVAAFLVLFGHVQFEAVSRGMMTEDALSAFSFFTWGNGVDIFFVISGFIMFHISAKMFGTERAQARFLSKRFIRLVPLYWFFTSAMLLAMAVLPGQIQHTVFDLAHIAASYVFIPWLNNFGDAHPVLGLGWTLNYEMYFYVVFSFMLLLPVRAALWALAVLFVALALLNPVIPADLVQLKFWSDPIIVEFLFGIGIAYLLQKRVILPTGAPAALAVIGFAAMIVLPHLPLPVAYARLISAGLPAAMVVMGFAFGRFNASSRLGRWLVIGGDASYALYLSHPFSINVVELVWSRFRLGQPWMFIIVVTLMAIAASIAVHFILEKPLTKALNQWFAMGRGKPAINAAE